MSIWKDKGTYYLHVSVFKSKDFFDARKGSISPTKFLTCADEDEYLSREDLVKIMTGQMTRVFTPEQQQNMDRGKRHEVHIIETYRKQNPDKKIYQFPQNHYPVYKQDTYIRGIPDAVIFSDGTDTIVGILECKSKKNFENISLRDYYQVLGYMAIFGAQWTDFLVYVTSENKFVQIRINFDQDDWNKLYLKLKVFKDQFLLPELKGKRYPLQP